MPGAELGPVPRQLDLPTPKSIGQDEKSIRALASNCEKGGLEISGLVHLLQAKHQPGGACSNLYISQYNRTYRVVRVPKDSHLSKSGDAFFQQGEALRADFGDKQP